MSLYREYEPIVLAAGQLSGFVGGDASRIALYVFKDGTHFEPIPFQIDKRRKIHVNFNVGPDDPGYPPANCEYGYYQELFDGPTPEQGPRADFSGTGLDALDEIVFLAKDTFGNTGRAPTSAWVANQTATTRYEITVLDPRTQAKSYAYAFWWTVPPAASEFDPTDYVSWEQVPGPCSSSPNACSIVRSNTTTPRLSNVATLDAQFAGNWITTGISIHPAGDAPATADVLERFRYTASPNEDEDGWTNGGRPRFLGYTDGKIRIIRAVQGALSGRRTTKYEFIYPTMFVTRVNLRVHDIDLIAMDTDHDRGFLDDANIGGTPGFVWTRTRFESVPPANPRFTDRIDGNCTSNCDPTGFGFFDWAQITSSVRHGYVDLFSEQRPMPIKPTGSRVPRYVDSASGVNPDSWSIGKFGRGWAKLACTEDGAPDNLGGCVDPEGNDEDLYFARLETVVIPWRTIGSGDSSANVVAEEFRKNFDPTLRVTADPQFRDTPPSPGPACAPSLGTSDPHTGVVDLSVSPSGPCGGTIGTRLYRSEAGGDFKFLHELRGRYGFVDRTTRPGVSYQYKAVSFNGENTETAFSPVVGITPTDTTPPPPPDDLSGFGGSGSATLDVAAPCSRLLNGINIYMSQVSGGPYTKVNSAPIPVSARPVRWAVGGLQPGTTYYFVATLVDFQGNESAYSAEVAITVGP